MRVLLVEDERKIAAYVRRGLEEAGYAVDPAFTGPDALRLVGMAEYDAIVLDIMLPEIDGLTACRELRARGVAAPILMLTARDTVDDRVAGLDAGADDYLVKPFAMKELLARLRALARRAAEAPKTPVLTVADLSLDPAARKVTRAGKKIVLSAKEFAILEHLMRNAGLVLTRTMITEHVWNYDVFHLSNAVDVYIRNLRRKMDDDFEPKLIQTIRGVGYRLLAEPKE
ncbi:MAG: response regulator transcription factor [Actinobacteria bacterium]|nr:response regulator transcription factor [Actinomycetota bacterium]